MKTYKITSANQPSFLGSPSDISPITVTVTGEDDLNVSDSYHTFDELYEHRMELYIALCSNVIYISNRAEGPDEIVDVWRSKMHSDGSGYPGWFILGIRKRMGEQISYHLPDRLWDRCAFAETLSRAPEWDGHTPADVLKRLRDL